MSDLPGPLTPAGCNLQDFPHTPIFRARLFGSSFHARVTDSEWRAGVTLWLKSWDQVPAGSLPDDDIELCRLAELARDLKTWKKVKAGAMRGWIKCSDDRLYHPIVAEGVNTALEAKTAQRTKTANARIAGLEKRLKEASDNALKVRLTEEIRVLRQGLSLSLSQKAFLDVTAPVTDPVTSSKRREGEEKGREGNNYSEAKASGAKAPKITDPDEIIFGYGVPMLTAAGNAEKHVRSFLGGLRKQHGDDALINGLRECARAKPLQPLEWLAAALPPIGGKPKLNAQEALEESNRAVAARLIEREAGHAAH